jgi:hypothetical protein
MKIAVRFRYYKAVTPSMQVVDLTDEQWREFLLLEDAEKRHDYMIKLLGKEYLDTKELWWIPLDEQDKLIIK